VKQLIISTNNQTDPRERTKQPNNNDSNNCVSKSNQVKTSKSKEKKNSQEIVYLVLKVHFENLLVMNYKKCEV
jgi:hypothetical protein